LALGSDELDVDQAHRVQVLRAPEARVAEQQAAGVGGGELERAVALLAGLGSDDPRRQPLSRRLYCVWSGRCANQPGSHSTDHAQELAIRADPGRRLRDRERDQLVVGDQALGARSRDQDRRGDT
jgi:hypothetical protein